MVLGVQRVLAGAVVIGGLAALAACTGGSFFAEREPWRKEAEARCIGSGAVREGAGVVRINPINGPGVCGADYPLKVSALGESAAMAFGDAVRPPGSIPGGRTAPPRWPIAEPPPASPEPRYDARPMPRSQVDSRPLPSVTSSPATGRAPYGEPPVSLDPPRSGPVPLDVYDYRRPYGTSAPSRPSNARAEPHYEPPPIDGRTPAREARRPVPLGPTRAPRAAYATGSISVAPTATLACPLVAALDQWIASDVQPNAMRWFGEPVVEIRQISAYSCRGMNGNPRARISEHAFGNALDIASFTLASGRRITVKDGWRGAPEEQGFLRDVQGGACERFTTVLAPGSNAFHYDHMHVDLMRRRNGYRACNPRAVSGEEVAARARANYARQGRDPQVTGSVGPHRKEPKRLPPTAFANDKIGHQLPLAVPGEDGED